MTQEVFILILNVLVTPLIVLVTLWVRSRIASETRTDERQDGLIKNLIERVDVCEKRHANRDTEIKEIRAELKNRDAEYLKLYQDYTRLKAKHDVLEADHADLKKKYDETAHELATLKVDIKNKAELAAKEMSKI